MPCFVLEFTKCEHFSRWFHIGKSYVLNILNWRYWLNHQKKIIKGTNQKLNCSGDKTCTQIQGLNLFWLFINFWKSWTEIRRREGYKLMEEMGDIVCISILLFFFLNFVVLGGKGVKCDGEMERMEALSSRHCRCEGESGGATHPRSETLLKK